ncbi:ankyrin repeat domain-containing protein 27-like [Arctopsyche grandis]|uniref:ankyrin repeat domain-containing protein 27-like n=1 Tax=Arctopsyche grandis TaxID=121162 RepID=UPI00406D9495
MNAAYDEDISKNAFLIELQSEQPDILHNCISNGWILCVPRIGSLDGFVFTLNDFLSHILVPDDELPKTHFFSLTEKSINVKNKLLSVETNDAELPLEVHILFEETFYTEDNLKYKVWCIEEPLYRSYKSRQCIASSYTTLVTLRDCIDFLWTESAGREVLETLDHHIKCFKQKFSNSETSLSALRDKISALYTNCLQVAFRNKRLKERSRTCQNVMGSVKLAVETYMHHGIYKEVFGNVSTCTAYEDSNLNKIIRNLADVQLRDLEIDSKFAYCIPSAKQRLSQIQSFSTVLGKVNCIKNTIDALNKTNGDSSASFLTTDELLPIVIFLVIKSGLPNWHAHLNFMKHFRFSINYNLQLDEISYLISTLEAVIEHIKSGVLIGSPLPESQWPDNAIDIEMVTYRKKYGASEQADNSDEIDNCENLEYLFKQIKLSNYSKVKELLEHNTIKPVQISEIEKSSSIEEFHDEDDDSKPILCHPLCSCPKCNRTLSKNMLQTTPSVSSCNGHGFTALHVACIYGKPQMVDLMLELGAEVNCADCNGSTPLHFAASRGHQNALLLLLHAGANINAENMDKNNPLHLASNNGHDSCVKALIYFAEYCKMKLNINLGNDNGETPLHLASKWGYGKIARLLLEYGADPWKCNLKGKTAIDYAHSDLMLKLLVSNNPNLNEYVNIVGIQKNVAEIIESNNVQSKFVLLDLNDDANKNNVQSDSTKRSMTERKIKPRSTEAIREVERLFRAITYGDTKLACFYMNIDIENDPTAQSSSAGIDAKSCHPLCNCTQCSSPSTTSQTDQYFNINTCDLRGNTALHTAAEYGHLEICKIILANGPLVNAQNVNGLSALHIAAKNSHFAIANALVEAGANVNLKDSLNNTPMHFACVSGNIDIVKLFLNTGYAVMSINMLGKNPLDEARDRLFLTIIGLLEDVK